MWKFRKSEPLADERSLRSEIEELKAAQRSLEGQMKDLQLQWEQTFQRMRRLVGAITKSAGLDAAAAVAANPQPPNGNNPTPAPARRKSVDEMTRDEIAALQIE